MSQAEDLSGWYQASDGQWYQPPGYGASADQAQAPPPDQPQLPQAQYPQAAYGQPQYPHGQNPQTAYAQPSQYGQGQYAQPQYPQDQYGQGQYAQGQYAQSQFPQDPYAQAQYPLGQYAQAQYPPGQFPPTGYGSPGYPYAVAAASRTNGMAIASLICAIGGVFFLGIPSILGIVFGFVSRSQIQRSNGTQTGNGLALAGIIVGFCVVAVGILILIVAAVSAHTCNTVNGFGSC